MSQQKSAVESRRPGAPSEQVGQRVFRGGGTFHAVGRETGFRIEIQRRDPGAVLSAVVLFFEQERHFAESVVGAAVLAEIVFLRLAKPEQRDCAFVFDRIRHCGTPFRADLVMFFLFFSGF